MLKTAVRNTGKLIRQVSREENRRIGRFFTKREVAAMTAATLTPTPRHAVYLLDAGAGTGILSAAAVESLCRQGGMNEIHLTCYETDPAYLPMLENNLERIRRKARHDYHVKVRIRLEKEDFLTCREEPQYDYVVMNPPHEEEETGADLPLEARFALLGASLLAPGGQMLLTLPTVFATGVTLTEFRRELFSVCPPEAIFAFLRERTKENLQKFMTLKLTRGEAAPRVSLYCVEEGEEELPTPVAMPRDKVIGEGDCRLTLATEENDRDVVEKIRALPGSFAGYGLKVHTGLTLESRHRELLRDTPLDGAVPLLHPRCLRDGIAVFPRSGAKGQFILPRIPSLKQPNKNLLLIKRAPAKSDKRRLMCGVHLAATMPSCRYISTHNKLNYVDVDGKEQMDAPFLFGLLGYLSSGAVDTYIRATSKSVCVNAKELMALPLPTAEQLRAIGGKLMTLRIYHASYCDRVVQSVLFQKR